MNDILRHPVFPLFVLLAAAWLLVFVCWLLYPPPTSSDQPRS